MRACKHYGIIRAENYLDWQGVKYPFWKQLEIRCPRKWILDHQAQLIAKILRAIVVLHWNEHEVAVYFTARNTRVKVLKQKEFEYWCQVVNEQPPSPNRSVPMREDLEKRELWCRIIGKGFDETIAILEGKNKSVHFYEMREVAIKLDPIVNGDVLGDVAQIVVKKEEEQEEVQEQECQGGEVTEGDDILEEINTGERAVQGMVLKADQEEDTLFVVEQVEQREEGEDAVESADEFGDNAGSEIDRVVYQEKHQVTVTLNPNTGEQRVELMRLREWTMYDTD